MAYFSTIAPLAGNAEVILGPRPTDLSDRIVGSVFSDQSGTLRIEQGYDGTNWDISTSISVTGGTGQKFSEEIVAPNIRLRYTNGATPQTALRLYARYSSSGAR